jgi:hypothetical protein
VQLNEQPADRVEVPGMIVTAFQDNYVPSRTIGYFGGVEAESYYGIYLLGEGGAGSGAGAAAGAGGPAAGSAPTGLQNLDQRLPTLHSPIIATIEPGILPRIKHGLQVLANGVERFFRLFGVWLLLLVPIYLSARRWAFLSRGLFYGGPR